VERNLQGNQIQLCHRCVAGRCAAAECAFTSLNAQVVVRTVKVSYRASYPDLVEYAIAFANDWADDLAIKTSATVPVDAWLPAPVAPTLLANLNRPHGDGAEWNTVTINAGVTPPTGGGFEIRRRDFAFMPGEDPAAGDALDAANMTFSRSAPTTGSISGCMTARRRRTTRSFQRHCSSTCRWIVSEFFKERGRMEVRRMRMMNEFEAQVLSDLSVLKTQMTGLMGDGNGGRIADLERRMERHEQNWQRAKGFLAAVSVLFAVIFSQRLGRRFCCRIFLRRRSDLGVTSTISSSAMNSMACSRFRACRAPGGWPHRRWRRACWSCAFRAPRSRRGRCRASARRRSCPRRPRRPRPQTECRAPAGR
jgi:hypothetical protein